MELLGKINLLDEEYITALPEVIKHEYCRIYDLLKEGENYGAMMQLKDAAETIIKLYASIGLAMINSNYSKSEKEIQLLFEITDKVLSLGDWAAVVNRLASIIQEENLKNIYYGIMELTDPNGEISLVEWRNKSLGHGALGYLEDLSYQESFIKIYNGVSAFLEDYEEYLSSVEVFSENGIINVAIEEKDKLPLYPFVTVENNDIYFFDSFIEQKRKLELLNYYYGVRKTYKKGGIYDAIWRIHSDYAVGSQRSVISNSIDSYEKDIFSYEMEEITKNNAYVQDSIKVQYIEDWINSRIEEQSKGLLWIQMPGGTGKTTFVQQLEKVTRTKININNTSVKAVYLNNTYNSNVNLILQEIDLVFTHNKNGKLLFKGTNKPEFDRNAIDCKKAMAQYLNQMFKMVKEQGNIKTEKLLLIFDGLDELSDDAFCDYLPNDEVLEDNLFILVTSRLPEEFLTKRNGIKGISKENIYIPAIRDTVALVMEGYLEKNMPNLTQLERQRYLEISNNNFAYLHFLVTYESLLDLEINEEIDITNIVGLFLDRIQRIYGEKYSHRIFASIYILSNIESNISTKQISMVLGEEYISFELIGILQDISGLLKVDRYRGNRYSINNANLKSVLKEVLIQKNYFDYEKEVADLIFGQVECIFSDLELEKRELAFSKEEYELIYTIFVCQFDAFIRITNYYFTGFLLVIVAHMLNQTFRNEYDALMENTELLYDKLCQFCAIQVEMINERIKEFDDTELKYYQILVAIFASYKTWTGWLMEKQRNNDTQDIIEESSRINITYKTLLEFKQFLDATNEEEALLLQLINYRADVLLQAMQTIYSRMDMPIQEIKYTNIMLERMRQVESEQFSPDYSIEYRILQHAYEKLGNDNEAQKYELLAKNDEAKKSELSQEISDYMHIRALSEKFASLLRKINDANDKERINQVYEIEEEMYGLVFSENCQGDMSNIDLYLESMHIEYQLACKAHDFGNKEKNIYFFKRLIEIYSTMSEEIRLMFDTEITLQMITYATNLLEWREVEESEKIVNQFIDEFDLLNDELFKQTTNSDELAYATNCLNIICYVLNSIRHPDRLHEIAKAKKTLDEYDIRNCDFIISEYTEKNSADGERDKFFRLISEKEQLMCIKNVFSKKGKAREEGTVYQFNQQMCRQCEIADCPAKRSPHRVLR